MSKQPNTDDVRAALAEALLEIELGSAGVAAVHYSIVGLSRVLGYYIKVHSIPAARVMILTLFFRIRYNLE